MSELLNIDFASYGVKEHLQSYLNEIWPQMRLFAQRQLRQEALAEDLVQEALLSAIQNADKFKGQAAVKTWVFSILRRKIADHFRKSPRTPTDQTVNMTDESEESLDILFDERGRWHPHFQPVEWGNPEATRVQDEFWVTFDLCLNELPEQQCTTFMMREYIGLSTDEIVSELKISINAVNVTLHRARIRLQQCLSIRWFGEQQ
ncbi:MAG: sigma-70 family RNA polymerase sigma factor [Pseudomonadota bacterium]|nr:sigma-70 family RNA polymerase sigma factor [Pseudomonadota bacterium]